MKNKAKTTAGTENFCKNVSQKQIHSDHQIQTEANVLISLGGQSAALSSDGQHSLSTDPNNSQGLAQTLKSNQSKTKTNPKKRGDRKPHQTSKRASRLQINTKTNDGRPIPFMADEPQNLKRQRLSMEKVSNTHRKAD